jgi:NAD/NADP transhydrogenase alpha subunit
MVAASRTGQVIIDIASVKGGIHIQPTTGIPVVED